MDERIEMTDDPTPCVVVVRSEPVLPLSDAEYFAWYANSVAGLLKVPGVERARWFESVDGDMRYMAMYELADLSVLEHELYPSGPWFGSIRPHVRFTRNVYCERTPAWEGGAVGPAPG